MSETGAVDFQKKKTVIRCSCGAFARVTRTDKYDRVLGYCCEHAPRDVQAFRHFAYRALRSGKAKRDATGSRQTVR